MYKKRKLWKPVRWFADYMQYKLNVHKRKQGQKAWRRCTFEYLREKLFNEIFELWEHRYWLQDNGHIMPDHKAEEIICECADIANYAMMIADKAREKLKCHDRAIQEVEGRKGEPSM